MIITSSDSDRPHRDNPAAVFDSVDIVINGDGDGSVHSPALRQYLEQQRDQVRRVLEERAAKKAQATHKAG